MSVAPVAISARPDRHEPVEQRLERRGIDPGGTLTMVVWRRREDNPWLHEAEVRVRTMAMEAAANGIMITNRPAKLPMSLAPPLPGKRTVGRA